MVLIRTFPSTAPCLQGIISDVTNALKSDAMPGANESYWYREAGLSQQACAISSEASSCLSCWNVEGAYSNLLCTVVMEDGCQKSKRLSYMAKFKREVIQCAEEKDNRKVTAIFGVDESNVWLWRKQKTAISGCEASRRTFTGPKKGRFPEIDDAVFTFFQDKLLYCSYGTCSGSIIFPKSSSRPRIQSARD